MSRTTPTTTDREISGWTVMGDFHRTLVNAGPIDRRVSYYNDIENSSIFCIRLTHSPRGFFKLTIYSMQTETARNLMRQSFDLFMRRLPAQQNFSVRRSGESLVYESPQIFQENDPIFSEPVGGLFGPVFMLEPSSDEICHEIVALIHQYTVPETARVARGVDSARAERVRELFHDFNNSVVAAGDRFGVIAERNQHEATAVADELGGWEIADDMPSEAFCRHYHNKNPNVILSRAYFGYENGHFKMTVYCSENNIERLRSAITIAGLPFERNGFFFTPRLEGPCGIYFLYFRNTTEATFKKLMECVIALDPSLNFIHAEIIELVKKCYTCLNGTQKNIIEGTYNYIFYGFSELNPVDAIRALKATANGMVLPDDINFFQEKDLWEYIKQSRRILIHDYPQNRAESYSYVGQEVGYAMFELERAKIKTVHPDRSIELKNGRMISKHCIIRNSDRDVFMIAKEKMGLLGLTGREDDITPPVTKAAVTYYIDQLVQEQILLRQQEISVKKIQAFCRGRFIARALPSSQNVDDAAAGERFCNAKA